MPTHQYKSFSKMQSLNDILGLLIKKMDDNNYKKLYDGMDLLCCRIDCRI